MRLKNIPTIVMAIFGISALSVASRQIKFLNSTKNPLGPTDQEKLIHWLDVARLSKLFLGVLTIYFILILILKIKKTRLKAASNQ